MVATPRVLSGAASLDVRAAAAAFRAFFRELREAYFERDALFTQLELALLSREHVLVTGPPGTAKSAIAADVLGRIVDARTGEPSLFSKQLSEATVQADLIGPVDFKTLTETGRTEHFTDEGMLGAAHAFLDEVFDGRDTLLRAILNVLHERELKHGRKVTAGRTECVVMTSNRYLSEVLARSPELLLAFADRLSYVSFVPKAFAHGASRAAMLARAEKRARPVFTQPLSLQALDVLQAQVEQVEVPPEVMEALERLAEGLERELSARARRLPDYVPTKYFSHRSLVKALWSLKAAVVRDRIHERPERRLRAELGDLGALRSFFLLGGPPLEEAELLVAQAVDPRERAQLEIVRTEQQVFTEVLGQLLAEVPAGEAAREREAQAFGLAELERAAEAQARGLDPERGTQLAQTLLRRLSTSPRHAENRRRLLSAARVLLAAGQAGLLRSTLRPEQGASLESPQPWLHALLALGRVSGELGAASEGLAEAVRRHCAGRAERVVQRAQALTLDRALTVDAVVAQARAFDAELTWVTELDGEAAEGAAGGGAPAAEPEAGAFVRTRQQAAAFVRQAGREALGDLTQTVDAESTLAFQAGRIHALDAAVTALGGQGTPEGASFADDVLQPLGAAYVRQRLGHGTFVRLGELLQAVAGLSEEVRAQGLRPRVLFEEVQDLVLARVRRLLDEVEQGLSAAPSAGAGAPPAGYPGYRAHEGPWRAEGLGAELRALERLLGDGAPCTFLSDALGARLASLELGALEQRVGYLERWWQALLPDVEASVRQGPGGADRALDLLVRSKLPALLLTEGELATLSAALAPALERERERRGGSGTAKATALAERVAALGAALEATGRAVLEARRRSR